MKCAGQKAQMSGFAAQQREPPRVPQTLLSQERSGANQALDPTCNNVQIKTRQLEDSLKEEVVVRTTSWVLCRLKALAGCGRC
jgi:hypothetical protein